MAPDLPDYTRETTILLRSEFKQQVLTVPWWVRYAPKRILFLDDFEGLLKWGTSNPTITKDNTKAYDGSYSMKLATPATKDSSAVAYITLPASTGKVSLAMYWNPFKVEVGETLQSVYISLEMRDGAVTHVARLRYLNFLDSVEKKIWQYADTLAPTWADIAGSDMPFDASTDAWRYFRLLVDPTTDKYVSLEACNLKLDLSALSLLTGAEEVEATILAEIGVYTDLDSEMDLWIDDVLFADNETT